MIYVLLICREEAVIRRVSSLSGLVLLLAASVVGQDVERHLTASPAGALCRQSAYVHGYIHGYESGFRTGDLDYHLGHEPRAVDAIREYRHTAGYRHEFGDSRSFRQGYRQGFRAAYGDAFRGIPYRGVNQVREAAQRRSLTVDWKEFDQAAAAGYDAGYAATQQDSMSPSAVQQASENCPASHYDTDYCEGFSRGFRLGYSDGFVNQQLHLAQTARRGAAEPQ